MRSFLYIKLALTNIKKNGKTYIPYILTGIITVAMYYIINSIVYNDGIKEMQGAGDVISVVGMGTAIVAIFACIFLFYTNSFLMKRRKKELGLYNVLGMGKRHIARMMLIETVLIALIDIAGGLVFGMVFSKLLLLLLLKITRLDSPIGFIIEPKAITVTVILFAAIFLVTLLYNMWQVFRVNTVELLYAKNQGEKEPKTKWILAMVGVLCLTAGYVIAIRVEQPLEAVTMFFAAVILVIVGTYALFTAGSIALLKMLRKKKSYYYKTNHFISVSGMIYRMKQNAVGLANICILSTMVLVMVSTTVSLYAGMNNVLETRFPYEFNAQTKDASKEQMDAFHELVKEEAEDRGLTLENEVTYQAIDLPVIPVGRNEFSLTEGSYGYETLSKAGVLSVVPLSWYNVIVGETAKLNAGEALFFIPDRNKTMDIKNGTLKLGELTLQIEKRNSDLFRSGTEAMNAFDTAYLVVADEEFSTVKSIAGEDKGMPVSVNGTVGYDVKGSAKEKESFLSWASDAFHKSGLNGHVEIRAEHRGNFYTFYGGFLFLGIFFGSLFLMATVLIIYYKQISEGYDDKERFQIMQKVGMSKKEVRRSIRSQVVSVFALPLIAAILHICVAFKVITRLLAVMNLNDVGLFGICTVLTVGIFTLIYGIVYGITAREYYKIVN